MSNNPISSNGFLVSEEKPDHHYRTEIPNIVFDLGLDPYTMSLYCHLKKIAGDGGHCWKSIKSLAKDSGMSEKQVKRCIDKLVNGENRLKIKLIDKINRKKEDGSRDTNFLVIKDIWRVNGDYNRLSKKDRSGLVDLGVGSGRPGGGVCQTYKQEPSQEKPPCSVLFCAPKAAPSDKSRKSEVLKKEEEPMRLKIKTPSGGTIEVCKDDLFTLSVQKRTDWAREEIDKLWEILIAYEAPIRDLWKFCEGTVKNQRKMSAIRGFNEKQNNNSRENLSCKYGNRQSKLRDTKHSEMQSKDINSHTTGPVTWVRPFADSTCPMIQRKR